MTASCRLTRHIADWMEYATAAGLREGDVLGITRSAELAGGGGPEEMVELHAALLSRAQYCLPPTFAGAPSHGAHDLRGLQGCRLLELGLHGCRVLELVRV